MGETVDAALKFITTAALGAIAGAGLLWQQQFGPLYVSGTATVIDGDNIRVGDQNIRLAGIDAPEMPTRSGQQCYKLLSRPECIERSAFALHWRVGGERIHCWITGNDALSAAGIWGRPLGVCFHGDVELNAWMLRRCYADVPDNPAHRIWRYAPVTAQRACPGANTSVASADTG